MPAQRFQSFWHGPPLTPLEQLSLRSFVDLGHQVVLYAYDPPVGVPPGVVVEPADSIVPRSASFVLPGYDSQGGFIAFSNRFRFELLFQRGGWWVDLDVVCLRSDMPAPETFFALEQRGERPCEAGSAVLRFPPGHEMMRRCSEETRRLADAVRRRPRGAEQSDFGLLGANVVERVAAELGLCDEAAEPGICYPLHWSEVRKLLSLETAAEIRERVDASWMIHLWSSNLRAASGDRWSAPPPGSFLGELYERHAIELPRRSLARSLAEAVRRLHRRP